MTFLCQASFELPLRVHFFPYYSEIWYPLAIICWVSGNVARFLLWWSISANMVKKSKNTKNIIFGPSNLSEATKTLGISSQASRHNRDEKPMHQRRKERRNKRKELEELVL